MLAKLCKWHSHVRGISSSNTGIWLCVLQWWHVASESATTSQWWIPETSIESDCLLLQFVRMLLDHFHGFVYSGTGVCIIRWRMPWYPHAGRRTLGISRGLALWHPYPPTPGLLSEAARWRASFHVPAAARAAEPKAARPANIDFFSRAWGTLPVPWRI